MYFDMCVAYAFLIVATTYIAAIHCLTLIVLTSLC